MTGCTAHAILQVINEIDWEKLNEEYGKKLLEDPKFLNLVFTQIISGEIKLDPHRWVISNETGRIEINLKVK